MMKITQKFRQAVTTLNNPIKQARLRSRHITLSAQDIELYGAGIGGLVGLGFGTKCFMGAFGDTRNPAAAFAVCEVAAAVGLFTGFTGAVIGTVGAQAFCKNLGAREFSIGPRGFAYIGVVSTFTCLFLNKRNTNDLFRFKK